MRPRPAAMLPPPPRVGDELPPFRLTLTQQRLVMGAAANHDFAPIHVDPDAARASGAPGVYANTTFLETVLEAALRSWAGPTPRIRMIEFSMTGFNCAGDEIVTGGVVTGVVPGEAGHEAELDVWIDGPHGRTVKGSARVRFHA
ncbi:MAG: MaoC/PaaZ C-terminal domain-containing protein [Thermoleophilaceae bacterium]